MQNTPYNGWHNYETWLFNLWYDNAWEDDAQRCWDEAEADDTFTREENAAFALKDSIEGFAEEFATEGVPEAGFIADLVRASMQEVNFLEIAKHYIAEVEREEA